MDITRDKNIDLSGDKYGYKLRHKYGYNVWQILIEVAKNIDKS